MTSSFSNSGTGAIASSSLLKLRAPMTTDRVVSGEGELVYWRFSIQLKIIMKSCSDFFREIHASPLVNAGYRMLVTLLQ